MPPIRLADFSSAVFFIGAGLSAECGVPTYRGSGGIWARYDYGEYACQRAFDRDAQKVLDFHELRRRTVLDCAPHAGHHALARLQAAHPQLHVVTQNIDGMLQRAGVRVAAELHGSLWRVRCSRHGVHEDIGAAEYATRACPDCGAPLRPDITWFEDSVDEDVFSRAGELIAGCDLFVSIGTSAVVYPAADFIPLAQRNGARMVEVNTEATDASGRFDIRMREPASVALLEGFR
ncbi:MAG: Sir2 family NAD-dependent protein deacetylase [Solimonas sp.]